MKRSARTEKGSYVKRLADEDEQTAARGEMSVIYKITKRIFGINVKQSALNALETERKQTARWVQHFQEVLNCPEPDEPANPQ